MPEPGRARPRSRVTAGRVGPSDDREGLTMRIVIALGGNALLRRGDPMTTEVQLRNIRTAAEARSATTAAGPRSLAI